MISAAFQKVYDEVMASPVKHDIERIRCDVCDLVGPVEKVCVFPGNEDMFCCDDCRVGKRLETILEPIDRTSLQEETHFKCDLCSTKVGNGHKWHTNVKRDMDVCDVCFGHSDTLLAEIRLNDPKFRYTKRGLRLTFVDPSTITYVDPDALDLVVGDQETCKEWAHEWQDLVCVPKDFVWMEWVRCMPWCQMKHYPASTSLACRISKNKGVQIASLLKASDGCISVNIVHEDVCDFLKEVNEFDRSLKIDMSILDTDEYVAAKMASGLGCDRGVMLVAATNLSEYIRLKHNLHF